MSQTLAFLQSEHVLALLITLLIFLVTLLLVVKRWINFPMTLLLLLFSLSVGLVINHQQDLQHYFTSSSHSVDESSSPEDFHQQMLKALENLKVEMTTEKDNLRRVITQVQEIFESMDIQKQKLQNFIEEARDRFQTDYPKNSSLPQQTEQSSQPIKEKGLNS